MRTQSEIESLIHRLFQEVGGDTSKLAQIKPIDGEWQNALSYGVVRKDGKRATIYRRDIDDGNNEGIKEALRWFK